ncbi:MAG: hypothetical protein ACERK0_04585 [Deltaproteobacteria bacterium]
MSVSEEKLAGVDQALAEFGKSDEEISEIRGRFARAERLDLRAVDDELRELSEGVAIDMAPATAHTAPTRVPEAVEEDWDDEHTEVEIMDESDFVLLVDEDDLEELERVGEDDALKTSPPAIPQEGEEVEEGDEDDGFFKKLFSGRRTSNRPQ